MQNHFALLIGLATAFFWLDATAEPSVAADPPKRTVAVLPLHAGSDDPVARQLAVSLGDVIANLLAEDRRIVLVEREKLRQVLAEQKLQATGIVDAATAIRLGKTLGADLLLGGSMVDDGPKLRLVLYVTTAAGGEVRGTLDLSLDRPRMAEDLLAAGPRLAKLADVTIALPASENLDDSPWGRLHLLRGLSCYAAKQPDQAIIHLVQAIRVDPRLVEARIWIARAYLDRREPDKARVELSWLRNHPRASDWKADLEALETEIVRSQAAVSQGGK